MDSAEEEEEEEDLPLFALEVSILFNADKYARADETTISVSAPVAVNVLVPLASVWLFVMVSAVDSSVGLIVTRVVAKDSMPCVTALTLYSVSSTDLPTMASMALYAASTGPVPTHAETLSVP